LKSQFASCLIDISSTIHLRESITEYGECRRVEKDDFDPPERSFPGEVRSNFLEHHFGATIHREAGDARTNRRKRNRLESLSFARASELRVASRNPVSTV
jgi:hypothetical protein